MTFDLIGSKLDCIRHQRWRGSSLWDRLSSTSQRMSFGPLQSFSEGLLSSGLARISFPECLRLIVPRCLWLCQCRDAPAALAEGRSRSWAPPAESNNTENDYYIWRCFRQTLLCKATLHSNHTFLEYNKINNIIKLYILNWNSTNK